MQLREEKETAFGRKLIWAEYLRPGFVKRSIIIELDKSNFPREIYFNSSEYGTAMWENGHGLSECHQWETEDDAMSLSYITRHYPVIMADGQVSNEFAYANIIQDSMKGLPEDLQAELNDIAHSTAQSHILKSL